MHVQVVHRERGARASLLAQARFVEYAALSRAEARDRASIYQPAMDASAVGACEVEHFGSFAWTPSADPERSAELVDVGSVEVEVGSLHHELPYALVPDLVSWVSGIDYAMASDGVEVAALDTFSPQPVRVYFSGSAEAGMPRGAVNSELPGRLRMLALELEGGDEAHLRLRWQPPREASWPLTIRIADELDAPEGAVLRCLVDDRGEAEIPVASLRAAGWEPAQLRVGTSLVVEARRLSRRELGDSGDFDSVELLVERIEQARLPVRAAGTGTGTRAPLGPELPAPQ